LPSQSRSTFPEARAIPHEHDLLLVALDNVENSAKLRATSVTESTFILTVYLLELIL